MESTFSPLKRETCLATIGLSPVWLRGCEVEKGPSRNPSRTMRTRVAISRDTSHHQHINRPAGLSGCAVIFRGWLRQIGLRQAYTYTRLSTPACIGFPGAIQLSTVRRRRFSRPHYGAVYAERGEVRFIISSLPCARVNRCLVLRLLPGLFFRSEN